MSKELIDKINSQLAYGDNRSEWVRDAIKMKFDIIDILQEEDIDLRDSDRREFVRQAVRNELDRVNDLEEV